MASSLTNTFQLERFIRVCAAVVNSVPVSDRIWAPIENGPGGPYSVIEFGHPYRI